MAYAGSLVIAPPFQVTTTRYSPASSWCAGSIVNRDSRAPEIRASLLRGFPFLHHWYSTGTLVWMEASSVIPPAPPTAPGLKETLAIGLCQLGEGEPGGEYAAT